MIKDKKGFLLAEETLKIIIAVISIMFLAYFLTALYFSKVNSEKQRFAADDTEIVSGIFSSLKDGDLISRDFPNPDGWYFFSFTNDLKPNSCAGQNCLCVCDKVIWDAFDLHRQEKTCDKEGSCLIEKDLAGTIEPIKITGTDPLLILQFKKENGRIFISS